MTTTITVVAECNGLRSDVGIELGVFANAFSGRHSPILHASSAHLLRFPCYRKSEIERRLIRSHVRQELDP